MGSPKMAFTSEVSTPKANKSTTCFRLYFLALLFLLVLMLKKKPMPSPLCMKVSLKVFTIFSYSLLFSIKKELKGRNATIRNIRTQ